MQQMREWQQSSWVMVLEESKPKMQGLKGTKLHMFSMFPHCGSCEFMAQRTQAVSVNESHLG